MESELSGVSVLILLLAVAAGPPMLMAIGALLQRRRQRQISAATYENDVASWASNQAQLLRERRFGELDVEHIAEELEFLAQKKKDNPNR